MESAAHKLGDLVNVDGVTGSVQELFRQNIRAVDNGDGSGWFTGEVRYGYVARSEYDSLLVNWDAGSISFYRGKTIPAKDLKNFKAAFTESNGK